MKNKQMKQEDAKIRNESHSTLSPQQKLAKLDEKFGKGVGAKKERTKLNKLIKAAN